MKILKFKNIKEFEKTAKPGDMVEFFSTGNPDNDKGVILKQNFSNRFDEIVYVCFVFKIKGKPNDKVENFFICENNIENYILLSF